MAIFFPQDSGGNGLTGPDRVPSLSNPRIPWGDRKKIRRFPKQGQTDGVYGDNWQLMAFVALRFRPENALYDTRVQHSGP